MTNLSSADQFQTTIATATPTLVMFGSPTCPWCRKQRPIFEAFGGKYPRIATVYVDSVLWPEVASRRHINALPTLVVYRGGKQVARAEGFHGAKEIEAFVEGALR